jgi:hypothetical protein
VVSRVHQGIIVELPQFRPVRLRIEPGDERSACQVADQFEIVSCRGVHRRTSNCDLPAFAQDAQIDLGLRQGLIEQVAVELVVDVVDGDDLTAGHQLNR